MAKKRRAREEKEVVGVPPTSSDSSEIVVHALTSHHLVVLAAYLLGGERKPIDTEDLAIKAYELAPDRFCWRKYKDRINLELVRVNALHAKNHANGALLRGSGNEGWMLTRAGLMWAESQSDSVEGLRLNRKRNLKTDRILKAERARLLASDAFLKLRANPRATVTPREVEDFFRIDPYVPEAKREERIQRVFNTFGDDPDLGSVVLELVNLIQTL
jgi:hypothetical protein